MSKLSVATKLPNKINRLAERPGLQRPAAQRVAQLPANQCGAIPRSSTVIKYVPPKVYEKCKRRRELIMFTEGLGSFSKGDLNALMLLVWRELEAVTYKMLETPLAHPALAEHTEAIIATVLNRHKEILESKRLVTTPKIEFEKCKSELKLFERKFCVKVREGNKAIEFLYKRSHYSKLLRMVAFLRRLKSFLDKHNIQFSLGAQRDYASIGKKIQALYKHLRSRYNTTQASYNRARTRLIKALHYVGTKRQRDIITVKDVAEGKTSKGKWQFDGYKNALIDYKRYVLPT